MTRTCSVGFSSVSTAPWPGPAYDFFEDLPEELSEGFFELVPENPFGSSGAQAASAAFIFGFEAAIVVVVELEEPFVPDGWVASGGGDAVEFQTVAIGEERREQRGVPRLSQLSETPRRHPPDADPTVGHEGLFELDDDDDRRLEPEDEGCARRLRTAAPEGVLGDQFEETFG